MKYIYCFNNKINNKKYIGSTIQNPKRRYKQHLYRASHENDSKYMYPLYCAIRKYGIENFDFITLLEIECSEEELRNIEADYILKYNTLSPYGYNQTLDTCHPLNDLITYQKISETKREKAKQVIAFSLEDEILGIYRSIVDCAEALSVDEKKIAACCRGERLTTNNKKFYWLDESNEIIVPLYVRDIYKGEKGTTQIQSSSRKIQKIDLNTKQVLQTYETIALAARENNCDASGISKVCRGKRNKAGGYFWKYMEEIND